MRKSRKNRTWQGKLMTTTYRLTLTPYQRGQLRDILVREVIDARERCMAAAPHSTERARQSRRYVEGHKLLELLTGAPF